MNDWVKLWFLIVAAGFLVAVDGVLVTWLAEVVR